MAVWQLAAAALVALGAAAVQAAAGFGFALLAAPLLVLIDPAFAPGPVLLAMLLLTALMGMSEREHVATGELTEAAFGLVAGSALGGLALARLGGRLPAEPFGVAVLVAVLLDAAGLAAPNRPATRLAAGVAAGLMGTTVGAHGPPLALLWRRAPARELRPTLAILFAVGIATSLLALALAEQLGVRELRLAAPLAPAVALGFAAARRLRRHLRGSWLRRAVLLLAGASALLLIVRG